MTIPLPALVALGVLALAVIVTGLVLLAAAFRRSVAASSRATPPRAALTPEDVERTEKILRMLSGDDDKRQAQPSRDP